MTPNTFQFFPAFIKDFEEIWVSCTTTCSDCHNMTEINILSN